MKRELSETEIIAYLKDSSKDKRFEAIRYLLYDLKIKSNFYKYVKNKKGKLPDAEDALQDAILDLLINSKKTNFKVNGNVKGYFFKMATNNWFDIIKKKQKITDLPKLGLQQFDANIQDIIIKKEKEEDLIKFLKKSFNQVKDYCQELLMLDVLNYSNKEIAIELGLSSENIAKKYKYRCRQAIKKNNGENFDWKVFLT